MLSVQTKDCPIRRHFRDFSRANPLTNNCIKSHNLCWTSGSNPPTIAAYTAYINNFFSKTSPGILLRFSASGSDLNCASTFIDVIQIYACSYKGMTGKYWGHRFKKYQHNKRHFNEPMQANVYIFRHRTCCFTQINQFYVGWFGSFGWFMLNTVTMLDTKRHLPWLCWMFRHLGWSVPLPKNVRSGARYRQCLRCSHMQLVRLYKYGSDHHCKKISLYACS